MRLLNFLYTNNLKIWEFDKEALQCFCLEQAPIAERQDVSEDRNFETKWTPPSKPNFSNCLCITFAILFFLLPSLASAFTLFPRDSQHFNVGPEAYYLHRSKEGKSKQKGWLYGVRGTYERLRCEGGFYWAVDGGWAKGDLKGHTKSGKTLKSTLSDWQVEGRLGYAFSLNRFPSLQFIPYGGYGYLQSKNTFKKPAIPCTYRESFDYGALGVYVWWRASYCLKAGIHFKEAWMNTAKCKVSNDPDYDHLTLHIGNKNQYEVELPVIYQVCCKGKNITFLIAPFFRYRHLGFQENYPFDHFDTQFRLYGIKTQLLLSY